MSSKADYTAQEWEIIAALPTQSAIAAAVSDGVAIIGTIREFHEGAATIDEGAASHPDNSLIAAILSDMAQQAEDELEAERMVDEGGAPAPADDAVEPDPSLQEPTSDDAEVVVTTSSAADSVVAIEAPDVDPRDTAAYIHEVIANATQARQILAGKSTPNEVAGYNAWVLDVVDRVINRTRSGGFLGIGGERVGKDEAAFRAQLAAALGASTN